MTGAADTGAAAAPATVGAAADIGGWIDDPDAAQRSRPTPLSTTSVFTSADPGPVGWPVWGRHLPAGPDTR